MKNSIFAGLGASTLACLMFVSADWWYLRFQVSGGWFSAAGDPSTVLPALGIIFMGFALSFLLKGSGRFTLSPIGKSGIVLITSLAILVTLSTVLLLTGELVTPAAVWWKGLWIPAGMEGRRHERLSALV